MNFINSVLTEYGLEFYTDLVMIILTDIVLSADNALIIGLAAAGLSPDLRKKAIVYGIAIAALLRIVFTIFATFLLAIPFIKLFGACLLAWVCWKLYQELREQAKERAAAKSLADSGSSEGEDEAPVRKKTLMQALWAIAVADFSMSLDNVLAVASIAGHNYGLLVFGLVLAIILMAFFANMILRLLTRFPIISWAGLAVLIYVTAEMFYKGYKEALPVLAG